MKTFLIAVTLIAMLLVFQGCKEADPVPVFSQSIDGVWHEQGQRSARLLLEEGRYRLFTATSAPGGMLTESGGYYLDLDTVRFHGERYLFGLKGDAIDTLASSYACHYTRSGDTLVFRSKKESGRTVWLRMVSFSGVP